MESLQNLTPLQADVLSAVKVRNVNSGKEYYLHMCFDDGTAVVWDIENSIATLVKSDLKIYELCDDDEDFP